MSQTNEQQANNDTEANISDATLDSLPESIDRPKYDRSQLKTGIVHIGPGNFFKAHQATYIEDILNKGDLRWGICAVSLRSPELRDKLKEQDNLYSVFERDGNGENARVIGCLTDILVAYEDPQAVINKMADPDVKLVTMTVTQNGYYYDANNATLDFNHPDIKACLDEASDPTSTVGYIVAALEKRMNEGTAPFTVMSCDNNPGNGNVLRAVVEAYANLKSPELREWIHDNVEFPNTMVDRITPKTKDQSLEDSINHGVKDNWPVFTETFHQWVIEDKSCNDMPDLASVGCDVVKHVEAFELMKIRMLNGSHMALGTIGYLSGYELADEAMNDPEIKTFIEGFMDEQIETLPVLPSHDKDDSKTPEEASKHFYRNSYKPDLIARMENPHMGDELTRLARNGSQKAPTRLLRPIKEAIAKGGEYDHLAFGVAAWMRYVTGYDSDQAEFDINDIDAIRLGLQDIARSSQGSAFPLLSVKEIFGGDLPANRAFAETVQKHLQSISTEGMMQALSDFNKDIAVKREMGPAASQDAGANIRPTLKQDFKP